jgi:hypothetical protein
VRCFSGRGRRTDRGLASVAITGRRLAVAASRPAPLRPAWSGGRKRLPGVPGKPPPAAASVPRRCMSTTASAGTLRCGRAVCPSYRRPPRTWAGFLAVRLAALVVVSAAMLVAVVALVAWVF